MHEPSTSRTIHARIEREGKRPCDNGLLGTNAMRTAVGWTLAMVMVLVAFRLPWYAAAPMQGWHVSSNRDHIELQQVPEEIIEKKDIQGGLITKFDDQEPLEEEKPLEEEEEGTHDDVMIPAPQPRAAELRKLEQRPILDFADQSPQIVGGLGELYLNIHYPEEALRDNVQGRAVIEFVVEEDGSTSNITILKPLHPACDSVAVRAIRGTRFIPGRQNGNLVRVKMRLPIRFRLLSGGQPADTLNVR